MLFERQEKDLVMRCPRKLTPEMRPAVLPLHIFVVLDVQLGVPLAPHGQAFDGLAAVPVEKMNSKITVFVKKCSR